MKSFPEIKQELAALFEEGLNLRIYFGVGDAEARTYHLADLDDVTTSAVCEQYVSSIKRYLEGEIATIALSQIDSRSDILTYYDLEEQPVDFAKIVDVSNGHAAAPFQFNIHEFSNIKCILIEIKSANRKVVFFQKFYPVFLIKRDQILLIKKDARITMVDGEVVKIIPNFDLMLLGDEFYINDFSKFEKIFAFDDIANKIKSEVVDAIKNKRLAVDKKGYLSTLSISRKDILRTKKSKVLALDNDLIIRFALERQGKIGLKIENGQLILSSKESIKKLFRLLNDDYLKSELTNVDYEALAKDELPGVVA